MFYQIFFYMYLSRALRKALTEGQNPHLELLVGQHSGPVLMVGLKDVHTNACKDVQIYVNTSKLICLARKGLIPYGDV